MLNRARLTCLCVVVGMGMIVARPLAQAAAATVETVHVVVTGGKYAGTYDGSNTKGGCSTGANGPGSWGNAYSVSSAGPNDLGSLSLIVPDAKAAAGGVKQFFVSFGIGSVMKRTAVLEIETRPSEKKLTGSGSVTVKDAGATAMVTIDGTTADGAKIHATIDCKTVVRMGGR